MWIMREEVPFVLPLSILLLDLQCFLIVELELFLDQGRYSCFLIKWRWKNASDACQSESVGLCSV